MMCTASLEYILFHEELGKFLSSGYVNTWLSVRCLAVSEGSSHDFGPHFSSVLNSSFASYCVFLACSIVKNLD
jgi:hypothetical protein